MTRRRIKRGPRRRPSPLSKELARNLSTVQAAPRYVLTQNELHHSQKAPWKSFQNVVTLRKVVFLIECIATFSHIYSVTLHDS